MFGKIFVWLWQLFHAISQIIIKYLAKIWKIFCTKFGQILGWHCFQSKKTFCVSAQLLILPSNIFAKTKKLAKPFLHVHCSYGFQFESLKQKNNYRKSRDTVPLSLVVRYATYRGLTAWLEGLQFTPPTSGSIIPIVNQFSFFLLREQMFTLIFSLFILYTVE